jgi:hypothetical protein
VRYSETEVLKKMSVIVYHDIRHDWCHVCGRRSDKSADIWYPIQPNAEHASAVQHRSGFGSNPESTAYIRVCQDCLKAAVEVVESEEKTPVYRDQKGEGRKKGK